VANRATAPTPVILNRFRISYTSHSKNAGHSELRLTPAQKTTKRDPHLYVSLLICEPFTGSNRPANGLLGCLVVIVR
jgi:hypothetical protein